MIINFLQIFFFKLIIWYSVNDKFSSFGDNRVGYVISSLSYSMLHPINQTMI